MIEDTITKVVHLVVEFGFNIFLMVVWRTIGAFELAELPRPTNSQMFGIVMLITCMAN